MRTATVVTGSRHRRHAVKRRKPTAESRRRSLLHVGKDLSAITDDADDTSLRELELGSTEDALEEWPETEGDTDECLRDLGVRFDDEDET